MADAITGGARWYAALGGWHLLAIQALWQSTIVGLVGLLAVRALRRSASLRADTALACLVLMSAAPVLSAALQATSISWTWNLVASVPSPHIAPATAVESEPGQTTLDFTIATDTAPVVADATPAAQRPWSIWAIMAGIWLLLSLVRGTRLAVAGWRLSRLVKRSQTSDDPSVLAAFAEAAATFGLPRQPDIRVSSEVAVPTLVGVWRPAVLIPSTAPPNVSWTCVAAHELAHLRRRDNWGLWLAQLVQVALPWQPLAVLLAQRFVEASEQASDELAVAAGCRPVDLADQLTVWLARPRTFRQGALSMSQHPRSTRTRIMRLLALPTDAHFELRGRLRGRVALATALVTCAASVAGLHVRAEDPPPQATVNFNIETPPGFTSDYHVILGDQLRIHLVLDPAPTRKLQPGDQLMIAASNNPYEDTPINGLFQVTPDKSIVLGPYYGAVPVRDLTVDQAQQAVETRLKEILSEPAVTVQYDPKTFLSMLAGAPLEYPIAPDGTITLPRIGSLEVEGQTLAEIRDQIVTRFAQQDLNARAEVSLSQFASRFCYLVMRWNGPPPRSHVQRVSLDGGETLLEVLTQNSMLAQGQLDDDAKLMVIRRGRQPGETTRKVYRWGDVILDEGENANPRLQHNDRVVLGLDESDEAEADDAAPPASDSPSSTGAPSPQAPGPSTTRP